MSDKKRLFLIDAYALIFRGYYAFIKTPRINSKGLDTSAILGFTNSLFDVIKREKPDYMAVCFDKGGSQDRIEIFEDYKANREETPEGIKIAVPIIEDILNSLNISILVKKGYEADDIIGTIAQKAKTQNFETYMVTPDKDFAQLVEEDVYMYRPVFGGGYETWGVKEVLDKFEISKTSQVIDFLAMKGDSVDNIPGLPGVGDKTAKKFLKEYGSLENLLEVSAYSSNESSDYQKLIKNGSKELKNHQPTRHTSEVISVIKQVPEGGNHKDLPPGVGESRKFNEAWTRYDGNKPSRTIDTGHRNHFHYEYHRVPTVRENCRLQSFPDTFEICGSKTSQNKQIGNAVPVLLAKILAEEIYEQIKSN